MSNKIINIVKIGLHSGKSVSHWVFVYGIIADEVNYFYNPYSDFVFKDVSNDENCKDGE